MKTSDSSRSWYFGNPLSVLRVMEGRERFQPNPKALLPAPESYESNSCGPKPERLGLVASGTDMDPVPVTGLAANFSPMPLIAPPPLGNEIAGGAVRLELPRGSVCPASFLMLASAFLRTSSIVVVKLVENGHERDRLTESYNVRYEF